MGHTGVKTRPCDQEVTPSVDRAHIDCPRAASSKPGQKLPHPAHPSRDAREAVARAHGQGRQGDLGVGQAVGDFLGRAVSTNGENSAQTDLRGLTRHGGGFARPLGSSALQR